MTTYTFVAKLSSDFVNWSDPSVWSGGVVPNSADADVVFPTVTYVSNGQVYVSFVTVKSGESFLTNSVSLTNNYLIIDGSLSVEHNFAIQQGGEIDMSGGSLVVGSLQNDGIDIQGPGQVNVAGVLTNDTEIVGDGLSLTVSDLTNNGELIASSGDLTVNVGPGGFANLSGTTLTGGTYAAGFAHNTSPNTLYLNAGGVITDDAATIQLSGDGQIDFSGVPIQQTLQSIAPSGQLSLAYQTYSFGNLTIDGALIVSDTATLNANQLTVDSDGQITDSVDSGAADARIIAPIANAGTITASVGTVLELDGPVTGNGVLDIAPGQVVNFFRGQIISSATLKLGGPVSENVIFGNGIGVLQLDDFKDFTGKIAPQPGGDQVILTGVSFNSLTGFSYVGTTSGGELTLHTGSGDITLDFLGNLNSSSFRFSAGPQVLSSSPPSLRITVGGPPTLSNVAATVVFSRNQTATLSPALSVADANSPTLAGATVSVTGGKFPGDGDALGANTTGTGITASYDASTEMLTLSGSDTLAHYQQVLDSVTFSDSNLNLTGFGAIPTRTITWQVNDGGAANNLSAAATTTLGIMSDQPLINPLEFNGNAGLVWRNISTGEVDTWTVNNGQYSGGTNVGPTVSGAWQLVGTGNFNGAGYGDLLWRNMQTGEVDTWLLTNGHYSGGSNIGNVSSDWQVAGTGDFNADGTSDILWRNTVTGEVDTWLMNNGSYGGGAAIGMVSGAWQALGTGDFNGDGTSDILWRNTQTGEVDTWLMNNGHYSGGSDVGTVSSNLQFAGIGDFTGNGTSDILWRNTQTGEVDVWLMNNGQHSGGNAVGNVSSAWQPMGVGDFNHDGTSDIAWRNTANGEIDTWLMSNAQYSGGSKVGVVSSSWQQA